MIRCVVPDCDRARALARDGWSYPMCDAHTCEALASAFGGDAPVAWHARARAQSLPTAVTGGAPRPEPLHLTPDPGDHHVR